MTISTTNINKSYSGNGSTHSFAYDFPIFADADLTVVVRSAAGTETVKTLNTHYIVTGAGASSGGNVLFKFNTGTSSDAHHSATDHRPASGETVVIRSELANTQTLDLVANDPFPASAFETALDKLVRMVQQHEEELDRSIKLSRTNTMTSTEFTTSSTDRASKVLAFDSSGELSVTTELGTFKGDWSASTSYALRDIVKDTSTNNIFIAITAHTSSGSEPLTTNTDSAKWSLLVDAATATSAQTAAASSASSASTSASTATTKASEAATSATASAASATAAAASETAAAASETASAASETASAASETASAASQTAAAASATSASSSASTATTKASEASTSASTATTKASEAASSQTAAASSASSASTSAGTATTKAGEAATSATNAASSATASASSATAAAASQTAAAASAASAASAFDNFDDTYLGAKSSNPAQDNDGNSLVSGALYFNSTSNEMRVYDGANWIAATSAGNVSLILYEYTATSGQTTFSGSDDNSATLSYTADNLQVVMNGVILDPSDFTATNGTSVVLASGAATNDIVNIYAFKSFTTADMVSKTNGGTFSGAVGFSGGITGDVAFDTSTLKVDAANNRVGIGTASPATTTHIQTSSGNPELRVESTGANYVTMSVKNSSRHYSTQIRTDQSNAYVVRDETAGANRFFINTSGNVGINVVPETFNTVDGAAQVGTRQTLTSFSNDAGIGYNHYYNSGWKYTNADVARRFSSTSTVPFVWQYAASGSADAAITWLEAMRIDASGHVGIGTASPTQALHVDEPTSNNQAAIIHSSLSTFAGQVLKVTSARATTNSSYNLCLMGADKFAVRDSGNVVNANNSYGQLSDQRLKENITDASSQWADIKALRVRKFNFIDDDLTQIGVVAQEIETAGMSGLVEEAKLSEPDADGNDVVRKNVKYSVLYMKAVKALQEAMTRIETLETKVAALEAGS